MGTCLRAIRIGLIQCLLFVLFVDGSAVFAQQSNPQPSPTPKPAEEETLELNTSLMRSTFKLIGNGSIGTAFVIGRPSTKNPGTGYFVLVTAAHVLEQSNGNEAALLLRTKEKESYEKGLWPIQIRSNGKPLWTKHPKADVAVMYISLPTKADIAGLSSTLLATDEILNDIKIHPGDNLFCLGYPNGVEANDAGFPVLRSGRIASYPILPTALVKSFLFDFNVFDGNSGGPVYLAESLRVLGRKMRVGGDQFIVGLVSEQVFAPGEGTGTGPRPKESLRLAIVIHASLIREAIESLPTLDK